MAQSRIPLTYPTFSKEEKAKMEQEIRQNLFQLPNEEEIEKNLDEIEYLKRLDEEYQIKKAELENKKNQLAAQRLEKLEAEQTKLAKRLEEIVNDPVDDEYEQKLKLIEKRRILEEKMKKEVEAQKQIDLKKREHEIEKKVKKKLELEKLLDRKKVLNQQYEQQAFQYQVIREEEEMRNMENVGLLEKALKRHGMEGDISEQDKILLSKNLIGNQVQEVQEIGLMLEEIQGFREAEKKKREAEQKSKLKELNAKRFEYAEQLEQILKRKAEHSEIQKKGSDFMTEVEMGQAPPLDYIKKNLNIDEDEYREFRTNDEIVERAKQQMEGFQDRVGMMRKELADNDYLFLDDINYYKGELKPLIARMNPESVFIARQIIDSIINTVLKKELDDQNILDAAEFKLKYLDEKKQKLEQQSNKVHDEGIFKQISQQMVSKIYKQITMEAGNEIVTVNQIAKDVAENIIIRAIKQERNTEASEDQLREYFYNTRYKKDFERVWPTEIEIQFTDSGDINEKRVKKQKIPQKRQLNQNKQDPDQQDQDQDEDDLDVIVLYPEQCVDSLGGPNLINKEIEYFRGVNINNVPFLQGKKNQKRWVTTMQMSFSKQHLGVGFSTGEIQILDTSVSPAYVVSQTMGQTGKNSFGIRKIIFPYDGLTQIMQIDDNGALKVLFNAQNLYFEKSKKKGELPPMSYLEYYQLNWVNVTRSIKRQKDEQNSLKFVNGDFHPSITFTGIQPFIMLACQNGMIMKFNSNKDIYSGVFYKFPIHRVVNSPILAPEDSEYPSEYSKQFQIVDNTEATEDKYKDKQMPQEHIYREFFIGHKNEIVFMTFLETGERFVTVDKRGYVFLWEYNKFFYGSSLGGYKPNTKNKVSLETSFYNPQGNQVQIFPSQTSKDLEKEGKKLFNDLVKSKDYSKKLLFEKKNDLRSNITIAKDIMNVDEQKNKDVIDLFKATVDYSTGKVIELYDIQVEVARKTGYVKGCVSLPENKQILIQTIMPHKIEQNLQYLQFIRFDTSNSRLKKTKIRLEIPILDEDDELPFTVVETFGPFGLPYIFVCMRQGLVILSLSTGSIVNNISDHFSTLFSDLKSNNVLCSSILSLYDKSLFISSDSADSVWKFEIEDGNPNSNKNEISNIANDYFRLYIQ